MRIKLRGAWARRDGFVPAGGVVEVDDTAGIEMVLGGFAVEVDARGATVDAVPSALPAVTEEPGAIEVAAFEPSEQAARTGRPKREK